jgi:Flp pilus assembly protein TadG
MIGCRHLQRGSSLPETAIVMAVLLALLFGMIDFGRAMYTYSFVAQIARQGARWAIVRGANCTLLPTPSGTCPAVKGTADIEPYVQSLNEGATNASGIFADLEFPGCTAGAQAGSANNAPGCIAQVTVKYPFSFMMPFLPNMTIPMSSTSQMVITN